MDFVAQNIFLITVAIISGAALILPALRGASANSVTPSQTVMLINRQHAVLLDVRDAAERDAGRIADSLHIALAELPGRTAELDKYKSRPIILLCASGSRSGKAVEILSKAGFTQVYNLEGGIKAWKDAGQALVSGKNA